MEILHWMDSEVTRPYVLHEGDMVFGLKRSHVLDVVVRDAPAGLTVALLVSEGTGRYLLGQGLLASAEGEEFVAVPLLEAEPGKLVAPASRKRRRRDAPPPPASGGESTSRHPGLAIERP